MKPNASVNFGLVLTGGGARAAYQAGVLRGIAEILGPECRTCPFQTVTGISAGAINAAVLASRATEFPEFADECSSVWRGLEMEMIVRTDAITLGRLGARWLRNLSMGGFYRGLRETHVLDTSPLRTLLGGLVSPGGIASALQKRHLHAVAVTATNYKTGTAVTFYDGAPGMEPWVRSARISRRDTLTVDHVLASASIPFFFAPVRLHDSYYGDGGIRMRAPLSPAIHLGAQRVLAIGIRHYRPEDMAAEADTLATTDQVTVADIGGVLLNAAFMDSLEADAERMDRINTTLGFVSEDDRRKHPHHLRILPLLVIRPSQDLGRFAAEQFDRFPRMLRHLLKGVGASRERGWELLSYLAFDKAYTGPLVELGRSDALARRAEIEKFFAE